MQNDDSKQVQVSDDTKAKGFKLITDGFSIKVNPEVLHEYAEKFNLAHLSYSLVRACYLRDVRQGLVS
jgi:hypothetical protein